MICDKYDLTIEERAEHKRVTLALEFGREGDEDALRDLATMQHFGGMARAARDELARREALS